MKPRQAQWPQTELPLPLAFIAEFERRIKLRDLLLKAALPLYWRQSTAEAEYWHEVPEYWRQSTAEAEYCRSRVLVPEYWHGR